MSIESRKGGRWLVAVIVVFAAGAFALLFRPAERAPIGLAGPIDAAGALGSPEAPAASAAPSVDWPEAPELERSYELADGEIFELVIDSGEVRVLPTEGSTARVRVSLVGGTRPPRRFEWTATRDEDSTRLRIRSQDSTSWLSRLFSNDDESEVLIEGERVKTSGKRARVGLVLVELPAGSPLALRSGAGDITVSDRTAAVSVDCGAGDVKLERIAAGVDIDTGAGDVDLEDIAGGASVDTGAGDVTARGVVGELDVDTGAGSVLFVGAPSEITIDTGAGGVEGELSSVRGAVDIDTGLGAITLRLPPDADAELQAESGLGSVSAEIDGIRLSAPRGEALIATLGEGGPRVRLRTGTGSIRVTDSAPVTEAATEEDLAPVD